MLHKAGGLDNLLFPPPNHRLTLTQIQKCFGKCRYINSNPNMQQAQECASKVSSDMGMNSEVLCPNNRGNSGTAISETTLSDLMAPLKQVTNKKQRID